MAFLRDDYTDDEAWLHERINIDEPFASLYHLKTAQRYDLLAHMANAMSLPGRDYDPSTERLIERIYASISQTWELGRPRPELVVKEALWYLDDEDFGTLLADLGLADNVTVEQATWPTVRRAFDAAVAKRLAPKVERMLKKLDRQRPTA